MSQWAEERPVEDFRRILAPDGTLEGDPPDLDDETLIEFYRTLVRTRTFDEKALRLQRTGEVSIHARSTGEEATPLGTMAALEPGDWCFPSYRQGAGLFYWGSSMARYFAGLMGAEPETINEHLPVPEADEPEINVPPIYVPLASNIPNAVGSALADVVNDRDVVSMAYLGDGSTSEGDFHEGMNFAGVFEAPVVVICQNNQWAISVPAHRQTASETFAQKADAYGIPHDRVDGNDIFAVFEAATEAVERARAGDGPTFIECVTYRQVEHNTSDEESVYRSDEMEEYWQARDPLDRFETYLRGAGVLDDAGIESIHESAQDEVQEAVNVAREVPQSDPQRMFDNHLSVETWHQRHQRAELRAEQESRNPFVDFTGEGL